MRRFKYKTVSEKARQILWGLFIVFGVIFVRIWVLAIVLHDQKVQESRRPQRRTVIERAPRAAIYDRFGVPLATNRVQYNAGICYAQIRTIPRQTTSKDEQGKKKKSQPRKEYVQALAGLFASELGLDAERVEDLIYSKAAVLGQTPYILKEDIAETSYFRLKMLEQEWPGLFAEVSAKRCYPQGAVGAEIVGYIGPMSRGQYEAIVNEMKILKEAVAEDPSQEELQKRVSELEQLSYAIHDLTGKVGIEAVCDERLRGKGGKRVYLTDIKGSYIQEMEGSSPPEGGRSVTLTVSAQLQAYAEQLLAVYNQELPSQHADALARRKLMPEQRPWIKEGAIVVMDPMTGDVLALASYPRFHPSDFMGTADDMEHIKRQKRVGQWLESESYLGAVWDGKLPLTKEKFDVRKGRFYEEECFLDWSLYLDMILPQRSPLFRTLEKFHTVRDAVLVQQAVDTMISLLAPLTPAKAFDLLYDAVEHVPTSTLLTLQERDAYEASPYHAQLQYCMKLLDPYFSSIPLNEEKLLLVDLYRLVVSPSSLTQQLMQSYGGCSLAHYRQLSSRYAVIHEGLKERVRERFHHVEFKQWREKESKHFLSGKRKEERLAHRKYSKPYLDYLDEEERRQFGEFWETYHTLFVTLLLQGGEAPKVLLSYVDSIRMWQQELMEEEGCVWRSDYLALQKECVDVEPTLLKALLHGLRPFEQLNRPLYGIYPQLRCDPQTGQRYERHLAQGFYPRYGYGYLRSHAFRQACAIGSIFKIIPAYAALSQIYQAGGRGLLNPLAMVDDKHRKQGGWNVGFFADGRPIPLHYHGGRLPRSDHAGIGRVDLAKALEASSNPYFALLAGEVLDDPEDLCEAARLFGFGEPTGIDLVGEYGGHLPHDVSYNKTGLYSMAIGQHTLLATPLQTAVMLGALVNGGKVLKPRLLTSEPVHCRWNVYLPEAVRRPILDGMRGVIVGDRGTARFACSQFPSDLIGRTIGKTSTAEVIESYGCDATSRQLKNKDIWFGAVIFDPRDEKKWTRPELVVVVYLKHGEFGRHAVPYALKMAQRWEELSSQRG